MQMTHRTVGDVAVLDIKGRLVLGDGDDTFIRNINRLVQAGMTNVLLNLEDMTYIDSAGLGVLVSKYITLRNRGGNLKVCNVHAKGFEVLTVTRLLTVFESFDSEADAIASFSASNAP
jgi:anti-sigma B factor antagonist